MDVPDFDVKVGGYFTVLIFDDYVIKVPRKGARGQKVKEVAEVQNQLAEKIPGVLPCKVKKGCLIMKKAPGSSCLNVSEDKWKRQKKALSKEIESLGYTPKDITAKNMFYDKGELYLVDFHLIEKK